MAKIVLDMVEKIFQSGQTLYQCPECGFGYAEEELAKQCETWCKEHHSCNIEITKHAVNPEVTANQT